MIDDKRREELRVKAEKYAQSPRLAFRERGQLVLELLDSLDAMEAAIAEQHRELISYSMGSAHEAKRGDELAEKLRAAEELASPELLEMVNRYGEAVARGVELWHYIERLKEEEP